ncbi:MAG TPA: S1 RNA-binding domain-containing protein, partial [Candidatus Dormibacteraeota bacterium]|nr:S1 RNA-binding domain-containing protein [Candidatus Dormibacteraeota bacterium]
LEGTVTKTKKYGAFLQIADGVEGLLHISELSWEHVERTEDVLRVGDAVKVLVLQADRTRRRISLSLRQLTTRPDNLPPEGAGSGSGEGRYDAAADYEPDASAIAEAPGHGALAVALEEAIAEAAAPEAAAAEEAVAEAAAPEAAAAEAATADDATAEEPVAEEPVAEAAAPEEAAAEEAAADGNEASGQ